MRRTTGRTEDKGRRPQILHKLAFGALSVFAALLVGVSFLPMIDSYRWWIRLTDFPRLQIGIALLVLATPIALYWRRFPKAAAVLMASITLAVAYHGYVLRPYAPTGPEFFASHCPSGNLVSILIANVKMRNDPQGKLIEMVRAVDPDIFLAMETNAKWDRALAPLADEMPHTVAKISDSQYGIHLFSRLELVAPEIQYFAGQDTPQVVTGVTLRNGETIDFLGVHPRPPLPSESALGRDAVLYSAALRLRDSTRPGVIAGDFNATPWETATERMRALAQLVDPRRSYGYVATFSAKSWWMAWPLDQIFHEPGFATISLERLDYFGSDHYPFMARLCRIDPSIRDNAGHPDVPSNEAAREALQEARRTIRRAES